MQIPLVLFSLSIATVFGSMLPGSPLGQTALLLGLVSASAAFLLLVLAALKPEAPRRRGHVVIDGSNVMHWRDNKPDLDSVKQVVGALQREGLTPVVWFDANAGYLTKGQYLGPKPLARHIGVPERAIFVAPKGTPADPLILNSAKTLRARVVTNDKFRDWSGEFPFLSDSGFLIPGRFVENSVRLRLL
ncbi:NYN domain-containing protein [Pararhodobacter oceanensis]|uniref:RNase NYN domain-containing protein n=1 Tax=Pararhodobacter oceanensis TaxID=2172121 RepID=A0A2T8HYY7_9RHOB|nr:hypothetical protein [Pararhodobacter oceanensis]PVH30643.1 hypothetical protein DDE20_03745 [Pararhodobacter oceanensis]